MILSKIRMNLFYEAMDLVKRIGYFGVLVADGGEGREVWVGD